MQAVVLTNPYLSSEAEGYQPRRIAEELAALGVSAHILPNAWRAHVGREGIAEELSEKYAFAVYLDKDKYLPRMLEAHGMRLFNRAGAVEVCDDKALTHIALAGIVPMPKTYFAPLCYKREARTGDTAAVAAALGYPVVVKECYGSLGSQVYLAENGRQLSALLRKLKLRPHLCQEFIAESAGRDLRAVCVGGEVVAAMYRTNVSDFRSNVARGGRGEAVEADGEVRSICKRVSSALGLDYCGIDLLFGKKGYLVCEVNSNAFFGGIEAATGINVARAYAEYMVKALS